MAYSLVTSYSGQSLINGFTFESITDPTFGFVSYKNYDDASAAGLVSVDPTTNAVTLSVDTEHTYDPNGSHGRPSVRIQSKATVNQGLVIGDFAHMPGSVCGAWPAFWMYGPNWPYGGEIDIIEGANVAYENLISAHTSSNCHLPSTGSFTGAQVVQDCNTDTGCNYRPPNDDTTSYGDVFNAVGGGVYALEWTADAIQIWHFPRAGIPRDIVDGTPDPRGWGTPQALFGTSACDVGTHFANMSIVLNTDFCGSYANALWAQDATCKDAATTCEEFIGNNPTKLKDLYWKINHINVYSTAGVSAVTTTTAPTPINSAASSGASAVQSSSAGLSPSKSSTNPITETKASSTAPLATDSIVPIHNPASIGDFLYLGCFSSSTSFSTFNETGMDAGMTLEKCTSLCSTARYSGVVDTTCYCADALDAGTSALPGRTSCNTVCPGNSTEYCGGKKTNSARRAAGPDVLLTVYLNQDAPGAVDPPPAPALGANSTSNATSTSSASLASTPLASTPLASTPLASTPLASTPFANASFASASPASTPLASTPLASTPFARASPTSAFAAGASPFGIFPTNMSIAGASSPSPVETITSTVTYTAVCSTNPAELVTVTTCITYTVTVDCVTATVTGTGVGAATLTTTSTVTPDPPLMTLTQSCDSCGLDGSSVVTLTIPVAVFLTEVSIVTATQAASNVSGVATQAVYNGSVAAATSRTPAGPPLGSPTSTSSPFPFTAAAPNEAVSSVLLMLLTTVGMLLA